MSTAVSRMTVEEFQLLPEPRSGHNELHHGELVVVALPKRGHRRIQHRLMTALIKALGSGWVVETEFGYQPGEHDLWIADVGAITSDRDRNVPNDGYLQGTPELVVEVRSPSNTAEEINGKMRLCLTTGAVEFWTVDDKNRQVEVTGRDLITRCFTAGPIGSAIVSGIPVEDILN